MLTEAVPFSPEASEKDRVIILLSALFSGTVTVIVWFPEPEEGFTVAQSPVVEAFQDLESVVRVTVWEPPSPVKDREDGWTLKLTEVGVSGLSGWIGSPQDDRVRMIAPRTQ